MSNFVIVDLHGMSVREALQLVQFALDTMSAAVPNGITIRYVTGRGLHSADGPRIRPALEKLLRDRGADFRSQDGFVDVRFQARLR